MAPRFRGTGSLGFLLVPIQIGLTVLVILGPRSFGDGWELRLPLDTAAGWPSPWGLAARIVGLALMLCGGLLALGGALRIGKNLTPHPEPRKDSTLLSTGAFGLVRHPMYGGLILTAFGWALLVNGPLTLIYACALFACLDFKSRHEERLLEARFEGYAAYRRRVRKLVPFVY